MQPRSQTLASDFVDKLVSLVSIVYPKMFNTSGNTELKNVACARLSDSIVGAY